MKFMSTVFEWPNARNGLQVLIKSVCFCLFSSRKLRRLRLLSFKNVATYWKQFVFVFLALLFLERTISATFLVPEDEETKVRRIFLPMKSFSSCQNFQIEYSALQSDLFNLRCIEDDSFQIPNIDDIMSQTAHVFQSVCAQNDTLKWKQLEISSKRIAPQAEIRECGETNSFPLITIVPYYQREDHLTVFLNNFNHLMSADKNLHLIVSTTVEDMESVKKTVATILSSSDLSPRTFIVNDSFSSPSRGRLRNLGAKHAFSIFGKDAHLLFTDVDIMISDKFLSRCRILSHQKDSVYFPIVWSEKKPNDTLINRSYNLKNQNQFASFIKSADGYWRDKGYGMVCTTAENFMKYGTFPEFDTWGLEDKYLFFQMSDADLRVHRFRDTGLIHKWHPKDCSANKAAASWKDRLFNKQTLCEKIQRKNDG